jgi:hypothetical protein
VAEHYCHGELFNLSLGQFKKCTIIILVYPLDFPMLRCKPFDNVGYLVSIACASGAFSNSSSTSSATFSLVDL